MILKRIPYILLAVLAIAIGLYPAVYFLVPDRTFGLLGSKTPELLANLLWNGMFYTHIVLGGIALLFGWIQFNEKIRKKRIQLHRNIGKLYIITVLLSAISGFYIGYYATGGWIAKTGFMSMAVVWFLTTFIAYTYIRKKDIVTHQKMMIYSYAVCFAAVTLRIWLPILSGLLDGFLPAYKVVAWLSWIPNLFVAQYIINRQFKTKSL